MGLRRRLRSSAKAVVRRFRAVTAGRRGPSAPMPHGHGLMERLLPNVAATAPPGYLIEVGSTREKLPGQGSTVILAGLAEKLGIPFVTVDMDPANTEQARADLAQHAGAKAVTARGEEFLASFEEPVLAAYLDAFDIQHGQHSEYRVDRYREFLGTEITNAGAAAMHLKCAEALVPHLVDGGLIVIDDTWPEGDGYAGKGSTAVPALLASGFGIVGWTRTAIALQRATGTGARAGTGSGRANPAQLLRRAFRAVRRTRRRWRKRFRDWRQETALRRTYRTSVDGRRSRAALARLHNSAQSRRCVIIGNGPSLNQMDLSVLATVPTFGLNRGYLLFERIGGPTTYLVSVNRYVLEQSTDEMLASPCPKFFNWRHRRYVLSGRDDVVFLQTSHEEGFSTDLAGRGLWEGATVTFVAMQLAYHLGYRDVVLIGVDHSFTTPGPAHQLVTSAGDDPNHFDKSYFGAGYRWQLPDLEMSERAYALAKVAFEAAGGSVVDATVGGKLTIFPKAEFTALFPRQDGPTRLRRRVIAD